MLKRGYMEAHLILPNENLLGKFDFSNFPDTLDLWVEMYFRLAVTTSKRSQKEQRRDLSLFLGFFSIEEGTLQRERWTPRLSRTFVDWLRAKTTDKGSRHYSDRTINRILAHLKTFGRWVHKYRPLSLGDPIKGLKMLPVNRLDIERALTESETRRMLDAADSLLQIEGLSRDRKRYKRLGIKPRSKRVRPFRNRAMVYLLITTGMRRIAVCRLNLEDIDFRKKEIVAKEKGGGSHTYIISQEGLRAIDDYLENERPADNEHWQSPALFLPGKQVSSGTGRLNVVSLNNIWNKVAKLAMVEDKTPHSARHAMGRKVIKRTGNIAAVQQVLGHKNISSSAEYSRLSRDELRGVVE
jgi:integrase